MLNSMCMFKKLATTTKHSCKLHKPHTIWLQHFLPKKIEINVQLTCALFRSYFRRKSISGNWKTNQGSAMVIYFSHKCRHTLNFYWYLRYTNFVLQLEQITMTEKYKSWINDVSANIGDLWNISTSTEINWWLLRPNTLTHNEIFFIRRHECKEFIGNIANVDLRYAKWRTHIIRIPSVEEQFLH